MQNICSSRRKCRTFFGRETKNWFSIFITSFVRILDALSQSSTILGIVSRQVTCLSSAISLTAECHPASVARGPVNSPQIAAIIAAPLRARTRREFGISLVRSIVFRRARAFVTACNYSWNERNFSQRTKARELHRGGGGGAGEEVGGEGDKVGGVETLVLPVCPSV